MQLHEEMFDDDHDGIAAESVAICTSLPPSDIDQRLDVGELYAEPVWEGWSYDEAAYCDIPAIPDGHRVPHPRLGPTISSPRAASRYIAEFISGTGAFEDRGARSKPLGASGARGSAADGREASDQHYLT
ncbi:hypothetical protein ACFXG4_09525 [Nocardia sp. NPDC059246]|uniref:hypothetical protein n=1 Tax=unclassified Nocardia TaxID=2637762 RepID=UPI0036B05D13